MALPITVLAAGKIAAKSMRILHLLSQLEITGAEAYAITLADYQMAQGHEAFIVSDKLHIFTKAKYLSQPISNRRWLQRFSNAWFLFQFVQKNKIDIIHAHSRAASWVAWAATLFCKNTAYISTVHGRQHLHKNPRKTDIYGKKIITVCENIKHHLENEMHVTSQKVFVIRNGINFLELERHRSSFLVATNDGPSLSILGRASGPKGQQTFNIIMNVLPALLLAHPKLKVFLAGGMPEHFPNEVREKVAALKIQYPGSIRAYGIVSQEKLCHLMLSSSLVIASGRIAISALYYKIPVYALGEATKHGLVDSQNFQTCLESNFGDIGAFQKKMDVESQSIKDDLVNLLGSKSNSKDAELLHEWIKQNFDSERISGSVLSLYQRAISKLRQPKHIPALMYHKVTDQPLNSKHKIFITKDQFERQMLFLIDKGFTTLTFKDYQEFRDGNRHWNEFPQKPIFLTFDDAYEDNHRNVLPFFKKNNLKATFFALGDSTLQSNRWDTDTDPSEPSSPLMNDTQLKEFLNIGCEVGAHSLSHRDLTSLPTHEQEAEICESKKLLEARLSTKIISFAYPYGKYSEKTKEIVQQNGYQFAVATDNGGLHIEDDPYEIFRASIFPQDGVGRLARKSAPWYRAYYYKKRGK
jgi:peptidoglycan/xylan/chitin deacetylase (PgdA/CDA1 family)/glycosyltransferase involved in cell wall biosynthesis